MSGHPCNDQMKRSLHSNWIRQQSTDTAIGLCSVYLLGSRASHGSYGNFTATQISLWFVWGQAAVVWLRNYYFKSKYRKWPNKQQKAFEKRVRLNTGPARCLIATLEEGGTYHRTTGEGIKCIPFLVWFYHLQVISHYLEIKSHHFILI